MIEMSAHSVDIAVEFLQELIVAVDMVRILVTSSKDKWLKQTPMSIMF